MGLQAKWINPLMCHDPDVHAAEGGEPIVRIDQRMKMDPAIEIAEEISRRPDSAFVRGPLGGYVRPPLRTTHTVVELEVPAELYDYVSGRLRDADYSHCFIDDGVIDMTGIALTRGSGDAPSNDDDEFVETKTPNPYRHLSYNPITDRYWIRGHDPGAVSNQTLVDETRAWAEAYMQFATAIADKPLPPELERLAKAANAEMKRVIDAPWPPKWFENAKQGEWQTPPVDHQRRQHRPRWKRIVSWLFPDDGPEALSNFVLRGAVLTILVVVAWIILQVVWARWTRP